jgi:CheY-like chemotaxis protein
MSLIENGCNETGPRHRVLVVDDNDDVADCLAKLLRQLGYLARACCSAHDCLELLYEFRPQVVLLDLSMPVQDGFDTCRLIRQTQGFEDLPVIACSALDRFEVEERGSGCGFCRHLVKPVTARQLKTAIEQALITKARQATAEPIHS